MRDELDPLAQPLNKWRMFRGLKVRAVAKRLGWPEMHLVRLEAGAAFGGVPTQEELDALARVYACEPTELLRPPSRDRLRRALGYFPPGFTQKEIDVIRQALRFAVKDNSMPAVRHVESIERKLAQMEERREHVSTKTPREQTGG